MHSLDLNDILPEQSVPSDDLAETQQPRFVITFWLVAFYYMISHGRIHLILPFLTSIPCAMIAGILAVIAFFLASDARVTSELQREEKLVLGLVVLTLVTLPTSLWLGGSVSFLTRAFLPTVVLMFITIRICQDVTYLRRFVWLYCFNTSVIIVRALSSDLNHFSKGVTDSYDVNDIAMILDCALPIVFFFMVEQKHLKKLLLFALCALAVITVVLSASRGGILGLFTFGCYLVATSRKRMRNLLLAMAALAALVAFSPEDTKERVETMFNPQTEYDRNLGDRTIVWKRGFEQLLSSPLLGTGIGNYSVADGQLADVGGWKTAHNSLLQIAVELGLVGFVLFVKLTLGTFRKFRRLRQETTEDSVASEETWIIKGIEASLLTYMVTGFFLSQAYNAQFYFIIALAVAVQRLLLLKRSSSPEQKLVEVPEWSTSSNSPFGLLGAEK